MTWNQRFPEAIPDINNDLSKEARSNFRGITFLYFLITLKNVFKYLQEAPAQIEIINL